MRGLLVAAGFAALLLPPSPGGAQSLGAAESFAIVAGTSATAAGTGSSITGNVGVSPGTSITGFDGTSATIVPPFSAHANDGEAIGAQSSVGTLYTFLDGTVPCSSLVAQLDGVTINAGVYCFESTADLAATGNLTLDGPGIYIFQVGSSLTANVLSTVTLLNGADPCDVFWQVTSAATLNGVNFVGNVVAQAGVTVGDGSDLFGRALTTTAGAVTIAGSNTIGGCSLASPTPTPGATATPVATATAAPTATPSPVPTATPAPTATAAPTATPSPVPTATPAPTATAAPTATPSPVPTATPAPSATPTAAPTPVATPTEVPIIFAGNHPQMSILRERSVLAVTVQGAFEITGVIDPTAEAVSVTVTNDNGTVFATTLPPGTVQWQGNGQRWIYKPTRTTMIGGVSLLRIWQPVPGGPGVYRFVIRASGPLSDATLANMTVNVTIGGVTATETKVWTRLRRAWTVQLGLGH